MEMVRRGKSPDEMQNKYMCSVLGVQVSYKKDGMAKQNLSS